MDDLEKLGDEAIAIGVKLRELSHRQKKLANEADRAALSSLIYCTVELKSADCWRLTDALIAAGWKR